MYRPLAEDELEEKYQGQLDDDSAPQYAYEYGMRLYEITEEYDLMDIDMADTIIYWLKRYISQEETEPECLKKSKYLVAMLFSEFPELREEYNNVK